MTNTNKAPLDVIAASLRRERHRAGLSLTEVARRAGIAKSTLSQLESGTGNPSVETLWAICVALDAPSDPPPDVLMDPAGRPHAESASTTPIHPDTARAIEELLARGGAGRRRAGVQPAARVPSCGA